VTTEAHRDITWSYAFPIRQLLLAAGLVASYNEKADLEVDGVVPPRAHTPFA
jgi:uncharacterized protein (DUF427 family)